jgi:signal peptidase I
VAVTDAKAAAKKPRQSRDALLIAVLVVGGAIIVCLRLFVFQPFSIPSASMAPTVISGDYVVVSKISYGYGPYSLSFATAALSRRFPADWLPQRGDVVVFRVPGKRPRSIISSVSSGFLANASR